MGGPPKVYLQSYVWPRRRRNFAILWGVWGGGSLNPISKIKFGSRDETFGLYRDYIGVILG